MAEPYPIYCKIKYVKLARQILYPVLFTGTKYGADDEQIATKVRHTNMRAERSEAKPLEFYYPTIKDLLIIASPNPVCIS